MSSKPWDEEPEQTVKGGWSVNEALRSLPFYNDREERRSADAFPDDMTPAEVLRYLKSVEIVQTEER